MVKIRLSRTGAKKKPFYHIVVIDERKPNSGRPLERLGFFNPMAKGQEERLRLDAERVQHWISQGAAPTARVADLIKQGAEQAAA